MLMLAGLGHLLPVGLAIGLALLTAQGLVWRFGPPPPMGRYLPIDGLRGLLAFSVMLHHAVIWYDYARTGQWVLPASHVFAELGQGSVLLFFMITSFLFVGKIADGRQPVDWFRLYVSRVLRLTPLYWLAVAAMLTVVGVLSGWVLREPLRQLLGEVSVWLAYTVSGYPDVNRIANTSQIVADVTWTLVYEWLFYLFLPVLAWLMGRRPAWRTLAFSVLALWWMLANWHPNLRMLMVFVLGGLTATVVLRRQALVRFAASRAAAWLALALLLTVLLVFPSAYATGPTLLLWGLFILIACGNTLFGVLVHPATRMLGEMAYSVYLLHGLSLYLLFHGVVGESVLRSWTPLHFWLVLLAAVPAMVLLSFMTWAWVERSGMRAVAPLLGWLRRQPPVQG